MQFGVRWPMVESRTWCMMRNTCAYETLPNSDMSPMVLFILKYCAYVLAFAAWGVRIGEVSDQPAGIRSTRKHQRLARRRPR